MNADARHAVTAIRRCIASDRVKLARHFRVRLAERGMLWADVLAVFDEPDDVTGDGVDDAGRERWIVSGTAADGTAMQLVCALAREPAGNWTLFITAYWND